MLPRDYEPWVRFFASLPEGQLDEVLVRGLGASREELATAKDAAAKAKLEAALLRAKGGKPWPN